MSYFRRPMRSGRRSMGDGVITDPDQDPTTGELQFPDDYVGTSPAPTPTGPFDFTSSVDAGTVHPICVGAECGSTTPTTSSSMTSSSTSSTGTGTGSPASTTSTPAASGGGMSTTTLLLLLGGAAALYYLAGSDHPAAKKSISIRKV